MKFVAYYRVSTAKQGQSGLGLEAQKAAAWQFAQQGIANEYVEIESGKRDSRPQLHAAITEAKTTGAKLLIAKLDRLSRNASFIFTLRDSGVDFVCCDMPDANTLTIGLFAVLAQYERETTSQRTKAALDAKKARGFKLGTPANLTNTARVNSLAVRQANARLHKDNIQATDIIIDKRKLGWTYQRIAEHLTVKHYKTRRGCRFTATAVLRLERVAGLLIAK